MSNQIDPCLLESAAALLRPFAVRAMRSEAERFGLASLQGAGLGAIEAVIDEACSRALSGTLVPLAPMTHRDFERHGMAAYVAGLGGIGEIGDLAALGKSFLKKLKGVTKKITGAAKKIAKKVVAVQKTIFKKLIVPMVAPTIAIKLKQRKQLQSQAEAARQRWEDSGHTDQAAYDEWQDKAGRAKKRIKMVQKQLRTAAAVTAAVVAAPYAIAAMKGSGTAPITDAIKDKAYDAVASKVVEAAVPDSQQAAADEYAASSEEMNAPDSDADQAQAEDAQPETKPTNWLAVAAPFAAALLLL